MWRACVCVKALDVGTIRVEEQQAATGLVDLLHTVNTSAHFF